ncbi:hypothetical protein C5167_007057 [Papaver somniferum]|uniref:Factor of DNA methylation 1-5/IDN2 domain-containing protein n=1 Tax=Papaver somniferum TaxID=3469 RepID=A0A4Y7JI96_PAPSO|nr:hypothetical protein C5167_007057 [Papaver somniferum]
MNSKKNVLGKGIESLDGENNKLGKKGRLQTGVAFLKEEKDTLHQDLSEEKDEFICGAIHEINESIPEREKALTENEKVVARERFYIEEFLKALLELIEQMASKKVTRNPVIGVKENTRGDPKLWNFREKKRATLKEAISFQFNRTAKQK